MNSVEFRAEKGRLLDVWQTPEHYPWPPIVVGMKVVVAQKTWEVESLLLYRSILIVYLKEPLS